MNKVVRRVVQRALERDVAAAKRDALARARAEKVRSDPAAITVTEFAALAEIDWEMAAQDRDSAAEDLAIMCRIVLGEGAGSERDAIADLTEREVQVLERLARAMTNQQIADDLHLGLNTIKTHVSSLFRKIGVRSRAQALRWALTHGYTRGGPLNTDKPGGP